jgi:hypothetical protein
MTGANQRRTEPVPPTEGHDVPDAAPAGGARPDAGAGTSTGPGPREGTPAIAREGLADGETDNRAEGTTTF